MEEWMSKMDENLMEGSGNHFGGIIAFGGHGWMKRLMDDK